MIDECIKLDHPPAKKKSNKSLVSGKDGEASPLSPLKGEAWPRLENVTYTEKGLIRL